MSGKRKLSNDDIYVLPFDISRLISHPQTACPACHLTDCLIPVSATASSSAFAACKGCNRRIALEDTVESPKPEPKATAPAFSQADFATLQQAIKDLQDRRNGYDQIFAENNVLKKENVAQRLAESNLKISYRRATFSRQKYAIWVLSYQVTVYGWIQGKHRPSRIGNNLRP